MSIVLTAEVANIFEELGHNLNLGDYDLLLVADGAGSTHDQPGGWACWAYDRAADQVIVHAGGMTHATTGFAELLPFIHALWAHDQRWGSDPERPVRVRALSDSEVTVRCGNGEYVRRANRCLWAALETFEQAGYQIQWTHVRRGSNQPHELADHLAAEVQGLVDLRVTEYVEGAPVPQ